MGGKSSGNMEFLQDNSVMKFTGEINLDGGGFSSVRRRVNLDLSEYAGVVVTLEADQRSTDKGNLPPIGLELQFDDRTSRYDFSSAFSVPLSSDNGDGPVVSSVYLPIESFDRGTFIGFVCQDNCQFDPSQINGISVYVLFQEGGFDVRLQSIEAVKEPRSFPVPAYAVMESEDDAIALLHSTRASGGGLRRARAADGACERGGGAWDERGGAAAALRCSDALPPSAPWAAISGDCLRNKELGLLLKA